MIRKVYEVRYMERFGYADTYEEAIRMENTFKASFGEGDNKITTSNNGWEKTVFNGFRL